MSADVCQGSVVLLRTSLKDIKMRDLYVQVDDRREITLLFDEWVELQLDPGEHRIKITNRLFTKRAAFDLAAGETIRFEVANVPGSLLFAPLLIISGTGAYKVALRKLDETEG